MAFCVLGDLLSKDVNDFYMSIVYDSIIITRLHILRMMSFKLLIIMVLILVLKISICITMFIIILTNGWNWMSIVNNTILIQYEQYLNTNIFLVTANSRKGYVFTTVTTVAWVTGSTPDDGISNKHHFRLNILVVSRHVPGVRLSKHRTG